MDSFAKIERNEFHQTILAEAILENNDAKVKYLLAEGAARTVNNFAYFLLIYYSESLQYLLDYPQSDFCERL